MVFNQPWWIDSDKNTIIFTVQKNKADLYSSVFCYSIRDWMMLWLLRSIPERESPYSLIYSSRPIFCVCWAESICCWFSLKWTDDSRNWSQEDGWGATRSQTLPDRWAPCLRMLPRGRSQWCLLKTKERSLSGSLNVPNWPETGGLSRTCAKTLHSRDVVSEAFLSGFGSLALEGASDPLLEPWWSSLLSGCWGVHVCHLLKHKCFL